MSNRTVLMAHLVAGYPDASGCLAAARGLVEGGAAYLEVQIPFSDPSADGPAIRDACARSLSGGTKVADVFSLVSELRAEFPSVPVFIMAYASLVATPGAPAFCAAARKAGAAGLIVPDLPFDSDEGLAASCEAEGLASVPVAAPSMRKERLAAMAGLGRPWLYAALRAGITGQATEVGEDTRSFLKAASAGGSRVLGGFGIRSGAQARLVSPYVHAVVAGSVFVDAISAAVEAQHAARTPEYPGSPRVRDEAIRRAVRDRAAEITGS